MTVAEMLHRMSSRELTEWQAYFRLEPFGEKRADYRMAVLASTIYNMLRHPKKSKQANPDDFLKMLPRYSSPAAAGPKKKKTPSEIYQGFRSWAAAAAAKGK